MFEEILQYTDELLINAQTASDFLAKVSLARNGLKTQITDAEEQLKVIRNPARYVASIKEELQGIALEGVKDIIAGKVIGAVRENYEFDNPVYLKPLNRVIKNDDSFRITFRGTGWNVQVKVSIDLNRTAGRLNRWSSGVKLARKDLEVKVPKKNSKRRKSSDEKASKAWAGIFARRNSDDKFVRTIKLRLHYSGAEAPFWQLLNNGEVPLASDRGGYPTPKKSPTNFIKESEQAAETYMSRIILQKKNEYEKLFTTYNSEIEIAKVKLKDVESLIDQLELEKSVLNRLKSKLDGAIQYMDSKKLTKAVQSVIRGIRTTGKFDVGVSGGKRKRISAGQILNLME